MSGTGYDHETELALCGVMTVDEDDGFAMHEVAGYVDARTVPTATTIELPDATDGFDAIANAADDAMWEVLYEDFTGITQDELVAA